MSRAAQLSVLLAVALLGTSQAAPAPEPGPVVTLKDGGLVRGGYLSVKGTEKRVQQYLGVPFARPPLGPLRLAAPQPAEPWVGERDATQHPAMCIQDPAIALMISESMNIEYTPTEVSEDCLYLNIYIPQDKKPGEKLPVMVWIHGGGLSMGGASQYDGSALAAYQDLVVVIIQYRLGILGFLSTGDEHAQGNWGFLDQILALKWVQQHVESFGGDATSVTIAGESAGGISASMLTISPLAKGLFHKAIFQSGVATLGSYTTKQPLRSAKVVAELAGCDHSTTELLVRCIRGNTEEQLVNTTKKMKLFLGATVDGVFLTDLAEEPLKKKDVLKVPVLMGVTNHEFGWILAQAFSPPGWQDGMDRQTVLEVLKMFNPEGASGANQLVSDEYLKDAKTPQDVRDAFTEILGDLYMVLPVIKVAAYHRDAGAPVYLYEFQHRPEVHKLTRPSFVKSDHSDDIGFMFGGCFWDGHIKIKGVTSEGEQQLCRTMMAYWANFVRTGSPNGEGLVSWPLFDQKEEYMELGLQQSVAQSLKKDKVHFMTVTLPQKMASLLAASARN